MKKTWIMSLAAVAVLLTSCMGSNNAAMAVGGELTGSRSAAFNEPAPFGMVLVPRGSLKLGEEDTDSLWGSNAPYKEISVESFWMDEACERTVMATDKHRFEYADKILSSWKNLGIHHKTDIAKADAAFASGKKKTSASNTVPKNKFNQFKQNEYDFDALEKELLSN